MRKIILNFKINLKLVALFSRKKLDRGSSFLKVWWVKVDGVWIFRICKLIFINLNLSQRKSPKIRSMWLSLGLRLLDKNLKIHTNIVRSLSGWLELDSFHSTNEYWHGRSEKYQSLFRTVLFFKPHIYIDNLSSSFTFLKIILWPVFVG